MEPQRGPACRHTQGEGIVYSYPAKIEVNLSLSLLRYFDNQENGINGGFDDCHGSSCRWYRAVMTDSDSHVRSGQGRSVVESIANLRFYSVSLI